MTDSVGASQPTTPDRDSNHVVSVLKSTPSAQGAAAISENITISTDGLHVSNVSPWIKQDVKDFKECELDLMLKEMLYDCRDPSLSRPNKSELLDSSLEAVLPLCNDNDKIKKHLVEFASNKSEAQSYAPFVKAANTALLESIKLDVPGLMAARDDEQTHVLFHCNDKPIIQSHQGVNSLRKPDIVIVRVGDVLEDGEELEMRKLYTVTACRSPPSQRNFEWDKVLSALEFKRPTKVLKKVPSSPYKVQECAKPFHYLRNGDEEDVAAEPLEATHLGSSHVSEGGISSGSKRDARHLGSNMESNKRQKGNDNKQHKRKKESNNKHPNVQNGVYTAEMFAAHPTRQHVYACVVKDDKIYLWYFDRQGAIQCSGLNFIQDMPRFLVLLLAMSRMPLTQWSFSPLFHQNLRSSESGCSRKPELSCNPPSSPLPTLTPSPTEMPSPSTRPGSPLTPLTPCPSEPASASGIPSASRRGHAHGDSLVVVEIEEGNTKVDLQFDLKDKGRTSHYGLRGRATNVYPVKSRVLSDRLKEHAPENPSEEMVAKFYWPEVSRTSESEILETVKQHAQNDPDIQGHVPQMVWSHRFDESNTGNIRKKLGLKDPERGSRVFYVIVFQKLKPITDLSGKEFLQAWWQAVLCHRALWAKGVPHRDISPNNIMYYRNANNEVVAVLNDYDLSSIGKSPSGLERTGTLPFMAIDLLTRQAMEGKVEHVYQHDAESFIWVLTWVCLRYEEGKLVSGRRPLDDWLTADAAQSIKEKLGFLGSQIRDPELRVSKSYADAWKVAVRCLDALLMFNRPLKMNTPVTDEEAFQTLLMDHMQEHF